jgi:hypothetical protein
MVRSCPKSLARVQPIRASRPNCGRVLTKSCTTIKPSRAPIRVAQNEYPSRGLTNRRAVRPSKPSSRTAAPRARHTHSAVHTPRALGRACARHAHSAVHTPEHSAVQTLDTRTRPCTHPSTRPHSLAQVTLDLLCSTLSYIKIMFCFYLYTSRFSAGLIMWDNSQFMFFFIFSSTFILT